MGVSEISGNTILAVDMHGDTTDNEAVISIHLATVAVVARKGKNRDSNLTAEHNSCPRPSPPQPLPSNNL